MKERTGNIPEDKILSVESNIHPGIKPQAEIQNPNAALNNTPSILDRILNSPTSRHITYTSGPNSR